MVNETPIEYRREPRCFYAAPVLLRAILIIACRILRTPFAHARERSVLASALPRKRPWRWRRLNWQFVANAPRRAKQKRNDLSQRILVGLARSANRRRLPLRHHRAWRLGPRMRRSCGRADRGRHIAKIAGRPDLTPEGLSAGLEPNGGHEKSSSHSKRHGRSSVSEIIERAGADDLVAGDQLAGRDVGGRFHPLIQRAKVPITLL